MAGRPVRGLTIILIFYFYHMQCMLNAYNITIKYVFHQKWHYAFK